MANEFSSNMNDQVRFSACLNSAVEITKSVVVAGRHNGETTAQVVEHVYSKRKTLSEDIKKD